MKKNYSILLIIVLILLAIVTNPGQEKHKTEIKSKIKGYLQEYNKTAVGKSNTGLVQAMQSLELLLGGH